MQEQELQLLEQLLFDEQVSRNRQFERFEQIDNKRIQRLVRLLRFLHKEFQRPEVEHWVEPEPDGRLCVHLHHETLGSLKTVFLTPAQWSLLQHPGWSQ